MSSRSYGAKLLDSVYTHTHTHIHELFLNRKFILVKMSFANE